MGNVVKLNLQKRTRLRDNRVALRKELDELRAKETSMAMLLHAIVVRHGNQVFELQAIEKCDPKDVRVTVDFNVGRVVIDLTTPPDSSEPA